MMRPRGLAAAMGRVTALLLVADGAAAVKAQDFLAVAAIAGTVRCS